MFMLLTRLGEGSSCVVTGDGSQVDLAEGIPSGLVEAEAAMKDVAGVKFIRFSRGDVVRHAVVSEIIDAYENYRKTNKNGSNKGTSGSR